MSREPDINAADQTAKRTARHVTAAQVTAAAAIITSILALAVSLYETRIMRSWQQASTQPIVQFDLDIDFLSDPIVGQVDLRNMGQGAAYIEGINLKYDDEQVGNITDLVNQWINPAAIKGKRNEHKAARGYLGPQDSLTILTMNMKLRDDLSFADRLKNSQKFANNMARSTISVCYCSVFERCWISDMTEQSRAKPVDVCPADYT